MFDVRTTIGRQYVHGYFPTEESVLVRDAFATFSRINRELFARIPYEVVFTEEDPYTSAKHMREDITRSGVARIFTGWSGHPFLTEEQNNVSRAVHDIYAHMVCGCPFTFEGEYTAYVEQRKHYPEWTWGVLFAEIPAQTAAYYYTGSFSYKQRAFEAPGQWMEMTKGMEKDFSRHAVLTPEYFAV